MAEIPSTNGSNGRDAQGRFVQGNGGGPGNPHAKCVAQLRVALLSAVCEGDIRAIVAALVAKACGGDVSAAKLVLAYTLGEPVALDFVEKLEALEAFVQRNEKDRL